MTQPTVKRRETFYRMFGYYTVVIYDLICLTVTTKVTRVRRI